MTKIENLTVALTQIPDGIYDGKWSAYNLKFDTPVGQVCATTSNGVRGIDCPVKVKVEKGEISFV